MAESGRRVAEGAWQDAEDARRDALAARREAETNWQQVWLLAVCGVTARWQLGPLWRALHSLTLPSTAPF
jgi:hypothetical protein